MSKIEPIAPTAMPNNLKQRHTADSRHSAPIMNNELALAADARR